MIGGSNLLKWYFVNDMLIKTDIGNAVMVYILDEA